MTTTTKTDREAKPRRAYFPSWNSGASHALVPADAAAAPKAVRSAAERVREIRERLADADREYRLAEDELKAAQREDRAADRRAAAEGSPLPEPTAPKAQAALDACRRRLEATKAALKEAGVDYALAVADAHGEWLPKQRDLVAQLEQEALEIVERLIEKVQAIRRERGVLAGLEKVRGADLRGVNFASGLDLRRLVGREEEKQRHKLAAFSAAGNNAVRRELTDLLAALRIEIEGRPARVPVRMGPGPSRELKEE